ncbi:MAG: hypothetical protein WBW32_05980, partial [Luteibacter sp.]
AQALAEPFALPRAQQALDAGFQVFQEQIAAGTTPSRAIQAIGSLDVDLVDALTAQGVMPTEAPLVATATQVGSVLDVAGRSAVATTDLTQVPSIVREAQAVILVPGTTPKLVYVAAGSGDVRLTVSVTVGKDAGFPNAFSAMPKESLTQLRDDVAAGRLVLLKGSLD